MGFFKFTAVFGKKKTEQAGRTIMQGLASWDPETASEAELELMIGKFEAITQQTATAKASYDKEKAEADAAENAYEKQLEVAERIQTMMAEDPDNAELAEALNEVVSTLEELEPELVREQEEAVEAKAWLDELEEMAVAYSNKLKTAKKTLADAKRGMERAKHRNMKAKDREANQLQLAGLKQDTDSLGSALSAMQAVAEKESVSAEASEMRSKLLKPTVKKSSALLDKISAEVDGTAKPTNVADRLAALRKK